MVYFIIFILYHYFFLITFFNSNKLFPIAHSLFNNIFFETHPELSSLKLDLEQLEVTYLCNINEDVDLNNSPNIESQKSNIINDFVDTVFTSEQIEKFYQIYHYNIMENLNE